jgi:hypothetical protein
LHITNVSSRKILKGKFIKDASQSFRDFYDYVNDEKYVEHDVYTFFKKIMTLSQKDMFSTNPVAVPVFIRQLEIILLGKKEG